MVLPLLAIPAAAACCGAYANDCVHEVSRRLAEDEIQEEGDAHVGIRERTASAEELQTNEDLIRLAQARRGGLSISDFNQDGPKTEFRKSVSYGVPRGRGDASSSQSPSSESSDDVDARRRKFPNNAFSRTIRFGGSSGDSRDESDSTTSSYYAPRPVMAFDEVGSIEVAQRFVEATQSQDSRCDTASITPYKSKTKPLFEGGLSSSDRTAATESMDSKCTFTCPSTPRNAASRLNLDGYIDGKFSDGRVFNVNAAQETWTLAYSPDGALLAVGLENGYGIAFYETKRYSLIRRISAEDTVVDVQWHEKFDTLTYSRQDFSGGARNELERAYIISAACKNGQVQISHIKYKVTKKEQSMANPIGQTTGYSIVPFSLAKVQLSSGARCSLFLPSEAFQDVASGDNRKKKTVEMAVGEKNGVISIISNIPTSLQSSKQKNMKPFVRRIGSHRGAAKCLAVTRDGRLLASGGELGTVRIHPIHHLQNESSLFDGASKIKKKKKDASMVEENQLAIKREGAVRALAFSRNGDMLIAGGYDKSVVVIHTKSWKTVRHMRHDGTVNAMAFDSTYRYLAVGSRDKSFTIYDTTTFHPIKEIQTSGWVSDLSWGVGKHESMLAARSGNCMVSVYNIQPMQIVKSGMESRGKGSCLAWSRDGRFIARVSDTSVIIAHAFRDFDDVARVERKETVRSVCFCLAKNKKDLLAAVGDEGKLSVYQLVSSAGQYYLEKIYDQFLDRDLRSVAWSDDGSLIVCGGKGKTVHFVEMTDRGFRRKSAPVVLEGIIFSIDFAPFYEDFGLQNEIKKLGLAVGTDDGGGGIVTLFDWNKCQKKLQVTRPRTVRSVRFHTTTPLLAIGDSGNNIVYIDLLGEQVMKEFSCRSRINTIDFSPCGRYIAVADDTSFSIRELMTFKSIQEIPARGSEQSLAFSDNTGLYLAIDNNNQDARILQLGPILNSEFIPLHAPLDDLPEWALAEVAYASPDGPSLLQRYMRSADGKCMEQTVEILKRYPESIFTVNRLTSEDCFFAVLRTGKAALMTLIINLLVTGALDGEGNQSILTTNIPQLGMNALQEMIKFLPPQNIVDIMKEVSFIKVPFTEPRTFLVTDGKECASGSYDDPWEEKHAFKFSKLIGHNSERKINKDGPINLRHENVLTPACLPLPGLGSYKFLTTLTTDCPAPVFDNDAMGLVLRIMWNKFIRRYFMLDLIIYVAYYGVWVFYLSYTIPYALNNQLTLYILSGLLFGFNILYTLKEVYQSHWCRDIDYFKNWWNFIDFLSIIFAGLYTVITLASGVGNVYLAVFGTLALSIKLLSYMRGFHDTGWLIAVLRQNFEDVRGFVAVLIVILFGFTVSFRLVFSELPGECEIWVDPLLRQECNNPPYGTLPQALFSTFQLALLGQYDSGMFEDSEYMYLASFLFILAVVVVLVVALNALIALLGDSYSRVQEKATANQRKERAELIVEYLSLLPVSRREKIEKNTLYFHALLEADASGDLLVNKDDWQGGLNALRKHLNQLQDESLDRTRQLMNQMRDDIDKEIILMRNDIRHSMETMTFELKRIQRGNAQNAQPAAIVLGGRGVRTAVNAVSALGAFGGTAVTSIGTGAVKAANQVGTGAVNAVTTVGGAVTTVGGVVTTAGGNLLHNAQGVTLLLPHDQSASRSARTIDTMPLRTNQPQGISLFSPINSKKMENIEEEV